MTSKEQLAIVVTQRISLTLTNLRIKEQLKRASILDPPTGLFNRRYMAVAFDRELRLGSRTGRPLGVIMLDVDRFKQINDQFGHAAADKVLSSVSGLLRSRLRAYDVPIRYGGDQIVILLPDTTPEGARVVAEKVRQGIRDLEIRHGTIVFPAVTISVGVAAYTVNGTNADSILKAADEALYKAKAEGRDRVVVAEVLFGAPVSGGVPSAPPELTDSGRVVV